ncbi:hypothetical protein ASF72_18900 [Arthrobacter sp. Leaf141]|nr:hypothetical protein ASF72_18900 [Arthrobacter sp. Leaf141]
MAYVIISDGHWYGKGSFLVDNPSSCCDFARWSKHDDDGQESFEAELGIMQVPRVGFQVIVARGEIA